jgi:probable HAF family extracellular repeat protein
MNQYLYRIVFLFWLCRIAFCQTAYEVIDLGTLGGNSYANGINASGQVVGYSISGNTIYAFLWENGAMTDLGTLGGNTSYAYGINDSGQVVGYSISGNTIYAFLWENGAMTDLGTLGGNNSSAYRINNSGQVVGYSRIPGNTEHHAFLWENGVMIDLGTLGGTISSAYGINASGQVVGDSQFQSNTEYHAFLWENGVMTDLGTLGGTNSRAWAINAIGQVIGYSFLPDNITRHAFLLENGVMADLGTLGGTHSGASDINNVGQVVGTSHISDGTYHAFLWENGVMTDLNSLVDSSSGWILTAASSINDNGEIVGNGIHNGQTRAFLLTSGLKITGPMAGEKWIAGETDTIKWTGGQPNQLLDIEYSTDNGITYSLIQLGVLADSGSYAWKIPQNIISTKVKIKLTDVVDTLVSFTSETFKIKPYILTRMSSSGDYDSYSKFRDPYAFGNDSASVWPIEFWQNFDYTGTDPFTGFNYLVGVPVWLLLQTSSSDHSDWVSWVRTFGVSACYYNTSFPPVYSRTALVKWIDFSDEWGGSCFGISTSNVLLFKNTTEFLNNYPSFPDSSDPILIQPTDSVRTVINELYTHQFGSEHLTYRRTIGLLKTPNQTLREIRTMLLDDDPLIRTLSIVSNDPLDPGGHSIMAYKVEQDTTSSNLFYVFTYDNAYPNNLDSAIIIVDTLANSNNGTWSPIYGWQNWGGTEWFYLRDPAISYFVNPSLPKNQSATSPFILGENELQILNTRKASIKITDQQGNSSGYMNGVLLSGIPGSSPNILENGSSGPPIGYDLQTANYSVQMSNYQNQGASISFYTANKSFKIYRNDAQLSENDRFYFDGGVSAINPDQQIKNINLLNIVNESIQEKVFFINEVEMAQNDSIKIINPDDNTLDLISYGSAKDYFIELNLTSESGLGKFQNNSIQLSQNTTHKLVPNWSELTNSQLTIYVDQGNDGIIDDTLYIENTVDVEDQGSLLSPNSYNLAQNYPNPFNPVTTIRYSIPQRSSVALKVYDVLGNEVTTLVNEEKERGVYAVNFDASGLASGLYLYRLQAGSFVQTKKMIVLK